MRPIDGLVERGMALGIAAALGVSCATPSRAQMEAQRAEIARIKMAHAVYLPKDVDSCVGITMRLADPNANAETLAEREQARALLSTDEVSAALERAGAPRCSEPYLEAVREKTLSPEPLQIAMAYGVDTAGRVCAVVERARVVPIDPAAAPVLDAAAECLKSTLFRVELPAGRVKDKARIVLEYALKLDPSGAPKAE